MGPEGLDATIRLGGAVAAGEGGALPRIEVAPVPGAELQLLSLLGEGGGGQVHLAHQRGLNRDVAVKMVNPREAQDHHATLLMQEGLITGRLEHPNIVPVYLMGVDGSGRPVIAMKRIEGIPWLQLGTESQQRHLEIFLDVCNAVAFAHARGYVHRDIKPANVMIGAFGEVYLLDWGISTRIGSGAFDHAQADDEAPVPLGTPLFLAPEQCTPGGLIDERTDIFLLGATLHRMLTGQPRHAGRDLETVLASAAASLAYNYGEEIPEELAQILNKSTARNPAERYASAGAFRGAVADYLRHRGSIELARDAEGMLDELAQLSEQGADQAKLRRICTECRFAFMRALRDWHENPRAARGLQRCLELMMRVELGLGQLEAAQALLEEMPQPNAALRAELQAAFERKASENAQLATALKLARELDPTVSKGPRAALGLAFVLLVVGLTASTYGEFPVLDQTPRTAIYTMVPFIALYGLALLVFRRKLLGTLLNRRWMALVGMGLAAQTLNRCMALIADAPFNYMLGADLLLIALIAASAGAMMYRLLYLPALIWALGFVGLVLLPNPMLVYAISQIGGLLALTLIFFYRRSWADPI